MICANRTNMVFLVGCGFVVVVFLVEREMSAVPYLTNEEILGIVEPLTQPAAIVRWFRSHGFPDCQVRPNGLPLIFRCEFESKHAQVQETMPEQPDVSGFLKKIANRSKTKAAA
jgi:hypothetical protein